MSALGGVAPIAAGGGSGLESIPAVAAAERVQQLQALIAQIERHPAGTTFASTLHAAQVGAPGSGATAGAYSSATPVAGAGDGLYAGAAGAGGEPIDIAAVDAEALNGAPSAATTNGEALSETSSAVSDETGVAGNGGSAYVPLIEQAAARYGLDPAILYGLIQQESGFDPSARSSAGALGLTQLMPSTAASLGVAEPLAPAQAIAGGARYLSQLLHQFAGNTADALAAYNAGPGAVQQYGGVPPYPETQQYVTKVLGYAAAYRPASPFAAASSPVAATVTATTPAAATTTGGEEPLVTSEAIT